MQSSRASASEARDPYSAASRWTAEYGYPPSRGRPLSPAEQPLDIGQLQLDVSRPAVIALTGIGHCLHLAQQSVHFGRLEPAPGAHRTMARHGRRNMQETPLQRQ